MPDGTFIVLAVWCAKFIIPNDVPFFSLTDAVLADLCAIYFILNGMSFDYQTYAQYWVLVGLCFIYYSK